MTLLCSRYASKKGFGPRHPRTGAPAADPAASMRPRAARDGLRTLALPAVFAAILAVIPGSPQAGFAQHVASAPASAQAEAPKADAPAANAPKIDAPKVGAQKEAPAPPAGEKAGIASAAGKRYVIGPLDVLNVRVWNQAQISGMVDVHPDGMISVPLVGEIKAEGLTNIQLKDAITQRLGEILTAPEVDVVVVKVNSKHYHVFGGVGRPGPYPLTETTTIMDALSVAGGLKEFAKPKIELRRGQQSFFFNYKDFVNGRNKDKNIDLELQNGDEIIVRE